MITSLLLLLISVLYKKFPPKEINSFYGYRTTASMKDPKTWKFANNYAAMWMVRLSLMLCMIAMGFMAYNQSLATTERIMIPFVIGLVITLIIRTERALIKYADKL